MTHIISNVFDENISNVIIPTSLISITLISIVFLSKITMKLFNVYNNYSSLMDEFGKLFLVLHLKREKIYRPKLTK